MRTRPDSPRPATVRTVMRVLLAACMTIVLAGCGDHDETSAEEASVVLPTFTGDLEPPAPRPRAALAADTACISAGCHASFALASNVHGVLRTADSCGVCHEPDQGGHVYPLKRPGSAGCVFCHENVVGQREHQHGATAVNCLECHEPHASSHASLLRTESVSDICKTCHQLENASTPHEPFAQGECIACHVPHESDFKGLLRGGEGSDHCAICHLATHEALLTASNVHAPAAQDCTICHVPHGSEHAHMLEQDVDRTCFACHHDIEDLAEGAAAPHGALAHEDQCANCHDAHASNQPSLLRMRQEELCLQCHDEAVQANDGTMIPAMAASVRERKFLHGPVLSGNCTACHSVHGGSHTRLLRQDFPASFYTTFDLGNYALCFECHDKELVTEPTTTALTGFRNGEQNLHYLHVNREQKGRTCRACHELHGSNLPAHIAESVQFDNSEWLMPIGFEQTDTGGSCAPGCHKPMGYDRVQPIPPPARRAPAGSEGGTS